jgi:Na+-transporting NADH:ubiquinone oxidoreductase subunit A
MAEHVIRRGLDIPIAGAASGEPVAIDLPERVVIDPREFRGVVPRLIARAGDIIAQGAPLFHAKNDANLVYRSPIAGSVVEIQRGQRRVITGIVIAPSPDEGAVTALATATAEQVGAMSRAELTETLCATGLWWSLRQRPLDQIAVPGEVPQAILVCGTETGPLQPGPDTLLSKDPAWFRLGLAVLTGLTDGAVHVTTPSGSAHPAFQGLTGVQVHGFRGPHPSGDPVVQVNHVCPPRGSARVWYIHAWEVERIGRAFATGRYPGDKICAAVGAGVTAPRFVKTVVGAPLATIVGAVTPAPTAAQILSPG